MKVATADQQLVQKPKSCSAKRFTHALEALDGRVEVAVARPCISQDMRLVFFFELCPQQVQEQRPWTPSDAGSEVSLVKSADAQDSLSLGKKKEKHRPLGRLGLSPRHGLAVGILIRLRSHRSFARSRDGKHLEDSRASPRHGVAIAIRPESAIGLQAVCKRTNL